MNNRPDSTILATARLVENLAYLVPQIRYHVRRELSILDSLGDHTVASGPPTVRRTKPLSGNCPANVPRQDQPDELVTCNQERPCPEHDTPVDLTPVERAANERMRLNAWLSDVEAECKLIAQATMDALRNGRKLSGSRVAIAVPRCCDGQVGKEGTIEWGDATCQDAQVKAALCAKHWQRWYRWRVANGIDTSRMYEPVSSHYQE